MSKRIIFITGNSSKFEEAEEAVKKLGIILEQKDIELDEVQSLDQKEVVAKKAEQAFRALKKPVIVDDTGIYFKAYNEFPGTYTKHLFKSIGFKGVEKLLKETDKKAFFRTMICYKDSKKTLIVSGEWHGAIIEEVSAKFNPEWQYNSIFIPDGFNIPLSEISIEERAKHSHRKKALEKLAEKLEA